MHKKIVGLALTVALFAINGVSDVSAKDWSKGQYKMSCTKNAKAKLKWFRKNGWSLFHTVHKKDSTLRVFNKGFTFKMAKQYKKSGKLCVYSE